MPTSEVEVIYTEKVGRKGYPRHYQALGIEPPMKTIVVELPDPVAPAEQAEAAPAANE